MVVDTVRTSSFKYDEKDIQKGVANYLNCIESLTRKFVWCHVPNGAYMGYKHARFMIGQGMRAGIPDILIFAHNNKTILIELKAINGKLSPQQIKIMDALKSFGFEYHIIKAETPGHAIEQVEIVLKQNGVIK